MYGLGDVVDVLARYGAHIDAAVPKEVDVLVLDQVDDLLALKKWLQKKIFYYRNNLIVYD